MNIWSQDADVLQKLLHAKGFQGGDDDGEPLRNFFKYGEIVQVALLEKVNSKTVRPAGDREYTLSMGLMNGPRKVLKGVACQTATAAAQLDAKEKKLWWDDGEEYTPKALADMELLQTYILHAKNT